MSMTLTGDRELAATLRSLGERVQRKVLRQAVSAGATPVVKSAKQRAKKQSGALSKSIGKKVIAKGSSATAIIGPRKGVSGTYKGKVRKPSRYAHLVEAGFIDEKGVHHPGHPFLNPALRETQGQALDAMQNKLADGVIREASK